MTFSQNDWRQETPSASLRRYRVYGITLASELPHNLPDEPGATSPTVELRVAQPHAFRRRAGDVAPNSNDYIQHQILADGSLHIRWEDWLELLVSPDGKSVLCGNRSGLALEAFDAYLTNFAVSAALLQQGEEPLHATVVETGDRAVGLVGPSGTGKSTLAAHLINRGWELLTDDMLRVTFDGDSAFAHPGPCSLKLFKESAERYLQDAACCGHFNPTHSQVGNPLNGKLIFPTRQGAALRTARRLSALFHLAYPSDDSKLDRVSVTPLAGQDLFKAMLSSTMNARHHSPARLQRQFRFTERMIKAIPVYRLDFPRRHDVMNDVADQLYQTSRQ